MFPTMVLLRLKKSGISGPFFERGLNLIHQMFVMRKLGKVLDELGENETERSRRPSCIE